MTKTDLETMSTDDAISIMAAACEAEEKAAKEQAAKPEVTEKDMLEMARKMSEENRQKMQAILESMAEGGGESPEDDTDNADSAAESGREE